MSNSTIFTKSVLKTKKKDKSKLFFLVLRRIIKNNPKLFFFCSLLAIFTAIINFNIGVNFKDAFITEERTLTKQTVEQIKKNHQDKKADELIKTAEIKQILNEKYNELSTQQKETKEAIENEGKIKDNESIKKKEAIELIEEKGKSSQTTIFKKDFKFEFNFFSWKVGKSDLQIGGFVTCILLLIIGAKSTFSLLHFYLNNYTYDSIERDLKKDLFRHFIRAKYSNATEISQNLLTQFSSNLGAIAYNIWFIPNRFIYVLTTILYHIAFDFNFGTKGPHWPFLWVIFSLFVILITVEIILLKKATRLSVAAKKRYEEDNKLIYERINNLEYIKVVSGEKYEEKKVEKQLDSTFQKNKKSLWYSVLFKAVPGYIIIPNIPIGFVALIVLFTPEAKQQNAVFLLPNFIRYYFTAHKLNQEMNKMVDSMLTLDELSSDLLIVNESAKVLNHSDRSVLPPVPLQSFKNGNIVFQNVVFAYPKRPHQDILRNFTFTFQQGKIYGIAGKNGIGKSTITKTTLKLYEIKEGQILIGEYNIQEIETVSLHQRICYQTNRPTFFHMSIAENVYYPQAYHKELHSQLVQAAQKTGTLEFIEKLPRGFDTVLKEGGTDLSEGQKQQIAAMRIFIRDYDIYILDEILSNVHPNLRKIVLQNVFTRLKNKTVLVIDHHYEIFKYVDYIYQFTGEKLIKMKKEEYAE